MKDENGEMAPDEDREAVEISRGSRNLEISGGVVGKLSGGCRLGEKSLSGAFWGTLNRRGKPLGRLSGGRPMKDENGEMTPDEDREAVENRETAEIARQLRLSTLE